MRELIHNLQPTFVILPGLIGLLIFPQKIQKEKVPAFYEKPYLRLRIAAAFAIYFVASFVISYLFAPKGYIWANTICIFVFMAVYYVRILMAIEKVRRDLEH
jgi:Ca2+-dependent lipid-binding protein